MKTLILALAVVCAASAAQAAEINCIGTPAVSRTSSVNKHEGRIGKCAFDGPEIAQRIEKACRVAYPNSDDEAKWESDDCLVFATVGRDGVIKHVISVRKIVME